MKVQIVCLCALFLFAGCFGAQNPGPSGQFPRGNRSWNGTPPDGWNGSWNGTPPEGVTPPEGRFPGGGPMMNMTVADMAQREGIDAQLFLEALISGFGLTENYTVESPLDELMAEGGFSPMEMRAVIDGLK